jgi:hypothetical protein
MDHLYGVRFSSIVNVSTLNMDHLLQDSHQLFLVYGKKMGNQQTSAVCSAIYNTRIN